MQTDERWRNVTVSVTYQPALYNSLDRQQTRLDNDTVGLRAKPVASDDRHTAEDMAANILLRIREKTPLTLPRSL